MKYEMPTIVDTAVLEGELGSKGHFSVRGCADECVPF